MQKTKHINSPDVPNINYLLSSSSWTLYFRNVNDYLQKSLTNSDTRQLQTPNTNTPTEVSYNIFTYYYQFPLFWRNLYEHNLFNHGEDNDNDNDKIKQRLAIFTKILVGFKNSSLNLLNQMNINNVLHESIGEEVIANEDSDEEIKGYEGIDDAILDFARRVYFSKNSYKKQIDDAIVEFYNWKDEENNDFYNMSIHNEYNSNSPATGIYDVVDIDYINSTIFNLH